MPSNFITYVKYVVMSCVINTLHISCEFYCANELIASRLNRNGDRGLTNVWVQLTAAGHINEWTHHETQPYYTYSLARQA